MNKENFVVRFILKNKTTYIMGIIFLFISSYVQTLFPKVLGNTIDILKIKNFSVRSIEVNIFYMLCIAAGTFASTYIWRNLVIGNARRLECHYREALYGHFQKMSPEFYSTHKTGDLIAYAINDISAVRMTFGPATAMSINGMVICIASIYSMAQAVNWRLTMISLLPIPFIVALMLKIGKLVQKRFTRVQESFAAISDRVQENIYGIRVIKAYVQEDKEVEKFNELNNEMMEANLGMVRISAVLSPIIELCFSISFVLNLIFGGNMVLKGTISLGDFIAFNTYLTMIIAPINSIGRIITIFQRGMASYKRLNNILKVEPEITDGASMTKHSMKGKIHIKDLNFSYPNSKEKTLKNINITLEKGKTLGIVGKTGSGKSTLVNLLLKLYNVDKGKIFLDDIDINDYTLHSLREGFGYVPQDNFLFSASVLDNIKFFTESYTKEEAETASKNSCIYSSIKALPDGFNTILGERGVNISGGQKQRIAIARALISNPAVLILDDSLSAVDTITESEILSNLKRIRKEKTTIIIAHKISSVKEADEIIVMENGKIIERGTHNELLKKGGQYFEIYEEQEKDRENGLRYEVG